MASKILANRSIWILFSTTSKEWNDFKSHNQHLHLGATGTLWCEFILKLDIGIECLSWTFDEYKITDKKKWALARIKYGL